MSCGDIAKVIDQLYKTSPTAALVVAKSSTEGWFVHQNSNETNLLEQTAVKFAVDECNHGNYLASAAYYLSVDLIEVKTRVNL